MPNGLPEWPQPTCRMDLLPDSILKRATTSGSIDGMSRPGPGRAYRLGLTVDRMACVIHAVLTCAAEVLAGVGCGYWPALPTLPHFSPEPREPKNSKCESGLPGDSEGFPRWEDKTYISEHCVSFTLAKPI